jgi:hypothetical protein
MIEPFDPHSRPPAMSDMKLKLYSASSWHTASDTKASSLRRLSGQSDRSCRLAPIVSGAFDPEAAVGPDTRYVSVAVTATDHSIPDPPAKTDARDSCVDSPTSLIRLWF